MKNENENYKYLNKNGLSAYTGSNSSLWPYKPFLWNKF